MTRMSRRMPSVLMVSAFRLCDTAVTPCDCSIENATTSWYDGSLPTSVMSVPCSVVIVPVRCGSDIARRIRSAR
jgi:hypothetical protein